MHTLTNKRPFFSIVVPCYNSKKTIGKLLNSIVAQNLDYDDLQVVLSDDCSTESYQDIVDKYKSLLNITQVKTDYNYCPGNTRQKGVDAAEGEWVIFADHDDEFVPDSFKKVKDKILESGIKDIIFTPFLKRSTSGQLIKMPVNAGWTHGKFFNLDNFWKKYNIHYIKDLTSHEDVSICTQLEYIRNVYNLEYYMLDISVYIWVENPQSLSNKKYIQESKQRVFLDAFFIDYIESTAGIGYTIYKNNNSPEKGRQWVENNIKKVLLYSYFYSQFAMDNVPEYLKKNFDHVRKYLVILKDQFNCSINDIYNFFKKTHREEYPIIFRMAVGQTDIFIYERSFKQWLKWIWEERY